MSTETANICPQCGAPLEGGVCKYCGYVRPAPVPVQPAPRPVATAPGVPYYQQPMAPPPAGPYNQQPYYPPGYYPPVNTPRSTKSKTAAGLLAIFLGGIGVHKFYLGRPGLGILYFLFCWTYVPALIGLIEGIVYLSSSDEQFYMKYVKH